VSRSDRRRELAEQRAAEARAQEEREAACMHWNCRVTRSDWGGRPLTVVCDDCGGVNCSPGE
jgi:hypothetical protein